MKFRISIFNLQRTRPGPVQPPIFKFIFSETKKVVAVANQSFPSAIVFTPDAQHNDLLYVISLTLNKHLIRNNPLVKSRRLLRDAIDS